MRYFLFAALLLMAFIVAAGMWRSKRDDDFRASAIADVKSRAASQQRENRDTEVYLVRRLRGDAAAAEFSLCLDNRLTPANSPHCQVLVREYRAQIRALVP